MKRVGGYVPPNFFKRNEQGVNMRTNIIKVVALCIMLSGMAGIAAAAPDPCPPPGSNEWGQAPDNTIAVFFSLDTGNVLHVSTQSGLDEGTKNGVPGIREVCVYTPSAKPTSIQNDWHLWGPNDATISNKDVAEFHGPEHGGENNNIPLDKALNPVGHASLASSDLTGAEVLIHINDPNGRCKNDPDGSCFIVPAANTPPVPEMSPIILTSAGLLGILLVSRKYRSK